MSCLFEVQREISVDIITDTGLSAGKVKGAFSIRIPSLFEINSIKIEPEYWSSTLMRQAVYEIIAAAADGGAEVVRWRYSEPDGADYTDENADPHVQVMRSAAMLMLEFEMKRFLHGRYYTIDLKAIPAGIWHRDHVSEEWLAEGGIKFVPLSELPKYAGQIRRLCDDDEKASMLSPLNNGSYDPDTSMLAVCGGEVMGWVVCRKIDDETVDFMKYYVAEKFRGHMRWGTGLIVAAIRRIEAKYSAVKLFLREDNPNNRRFYAYYFKEAFIAGTRHFVIELDTKNRAGSV